MSLMQSRYFNHTSNPALKPFSFLKSTVLALSLISLVACSGGGSSGGGSTNPSTKKVTQIDIVAPQVLNHTGGRVFISGKNLGTASIKLDSKPLTAVVNNDEYIEVILPAKEVGTYTLEINDKSQSIEYLNSKVKQVVIGLYHACALLADKSVTCWGANSSGELGIGTADSKNHPPTVVTGLTNVVTLVAGNSHTCAILSDKSVKCWGSNGIGQLGDNTQENRTQPVSVLNSDATAPLTNVLHLSASSSHTCAVIGASASATQGAVQCWGDNYYQRIDATASSSVKYKTPHATKWTLGVSKVAAGSQHTCVLKTGNALDCIGDATAASMTKTSGFAASEISAGYYHSCALMNDKRVQCWGNNNEGRLGNNTTTNSSANTPVVAQGISNATQLSVGNGHSCALEGSQIKCWGNNSYKQLGTGHEAYNKVPTLVKGINNATQVTTGYYSSCAILDNQALTCWGRAAILNKSSLTLKHLQPITVPFNPDVKLLTGAPKSITQAVTGEDFMCLLLEDKTVMCKGANDQGQLGIGNQNAKTQLTLVPNLNNVIQLSAGYQHVCALLENNTVKCWGLNYYGQLGDGSTSNQATPTLVQNISTATQIGTGEYYSCALLQDKRVKCWGANNANQLTAAAGTRETSPFAIAGLTGVTQISVGKYHTCALKGNKKVACWGNNSSGQSSGAANSVDAPTEVATLANVTQISTGDYYSCALLENQQVKCWGVRHGSDASVGEKRSATLVQGVANAKQLVKSCALLDDHSLKCWRNAPAENVPVEGNIKGLSAGQKNKFNLIQGHITSLIDY